MYRWQTLTLARVESGLGEPVPASLLDTVKSYLLKIGQRHFPEPDVGWPPCRSDDPGPQVSLIWRVDGRELQAFFRPDGVYHTARLDGGREQKDPLARPAGFDEVGYEVHWLLFGRDPQPAVSLLAKGDAPRTPADMEKLVDRLRENPIGHGHPLADAARDRHF